MQPIIWELRRGRSLMMARNQSRRGIGPLIANRPMPQQPRISVAGVTRDSAGAILGSCEVELYRRNQDQTLGVFVDRMVSDPSTGAFSFPAGLGQLYMTIAYKVGSPDLAGATVRTVAGA